MSSTKTTVCEVDKSINSNILHYYSIDRRIGKGAYGVVWKAYKRSNNQPVALKKIFDAFQNKEDAQRTYREVTYLKAFKGHPNIIQLLNVHRANNRSDIFLVFEFMNTDLHNYIRSGNKLGDHQVRYITFQILKALKFIHSGNVIHRDLKPSNILLNVDYVCKLADFGLARSLGGTQINCKNPLTDYVATRWYRAPEILLGSKKYSKVVDIWSLGCVMAEMVIGKPLFPGDSTAQQLELIVSTVGHGKAEEDKLSRVCGGRPRARARVPLKELLWRGSCECVDLASRLLRLDPSLRPAAQDALGHPFVAGLRSKRGEPALARPVRLPFRDNSRLPVDDYRAALYRFEGATFPQVANKGHIQRSNNRFVARSEPESIAYRESTRYPPLTSSTFCRGNFHTKLSLRN